MKKSIFKKNIKPPKKSGFGGGGYLKNPKNTYGLGFFKPWLFSVS